MKIIERTLEWRGPTLWAVTPEGLAHCVGAVEQDIVHGWILRVRGLRVGRFEDEESARAALEGYA